MSLTFLEKCRIEKALLLANGAQDETARLTFRDAYDDLYEVIAAIVADRANSAPPPGIPMNASSSPKPAPPRSRKRGSP